MKAGDIDKVMQILGETLPGDDLPVVSQMAARQYDPFAILISTIISLRTKDEVTAAATERLLKIAGRPGEMAELTEEIIAGAIFPSGFYRNKARTIREISQIIVENYGGAVPDSLEELLKFKGVGRKTANLVVSLGFGKDAICVDTHVHRISNRLGFVATKTPEKTETALRNKLPRPYWRIYNTLMVAFGQKVCRPVSPFCGICPILELCDRVGVTKSR